MAETAEEAVRQCEPRGNEFSLGTQYVTILSFHVFIHVSFLFLRGEIVRLAPRARIHVGVDAKTGRQRGRIPRFEKVKQTKNKQNRARFTSRKAESARGETDICQGAMNSSLALGSSSSG